MAAHLPVSSWRSRALLATAVLCAAIAGAYMALGWRQQDDTEVAPAMLPLRSVALQGAAPPHGAAAALAPPAAAALPVAAAAKAPSVAPGAFANYPRHSGRGPVAN